MKLISDIKLKDIRNYERYNNISILEKLQNRSISTIIDIIMISNNIENREDASSLLDVYLEDEENTIDSAIKEIVDTLTGGKFTKSDTSLSNGYIEEDTSYSEILEKFNQELMAYGISYSEFWEMTVEDMYRVAEGIVYKIETEFNMYLQKAYISASMNAQALCGKLPKKPPVINIRSKGNDNNSDEFIPDKETQARINALNAKAWALSLKIKEGMV